MVNHTRVICMHMICNDCSFAGNPRRWEHGAESWVECTFLNVDKPVTSHCQVCARGLELRLDYVRADLDQLHELREARADGLLDWDDPMRDILFDLEEEEPELVKQPIRISRLRRQAAGVDARCPKCGYWRIDEAERRCPHDGSLLNVAAA